MEIAQKHCLLKMALNAEVKVIVLMENVYRFVNNFQIIQLLVFAKMVNRSIFNLNQNIKKIYLADESCMRCCRYFETKKCFPIKPIRYLAEGSICIHGQCHNVINYFKI